MRLYYCRSRIRTNTDLMKSNRCCLLLVLVHLLLLVVDWYHHHAGLVTLVMAEQPQLASQHDVNWKISDNTNNKKTSGTTTLRTAFSATTTKPPLTNLFGHERSNNTSSPSFSPATTSLSPFLKNSNSIFWPDNIAAVPFLPRSSSSSSSSSPTLLLAQRAAMATSLLSSSLLLPAAPPIDATAPSSSFSSSSSTTTSPKRREKQQQATLLINSDDETILQQSSSSTRRREWLLGEIAKRQETIGSSTSSTLSTTLSSTTSSSTATNKKDAKVLDLQELFAQVDERDGLDVWGLEHERKTLSQPSWACHDKNEEIHLAAMKLLLEDDLQRISIRVRQAFPDVYGDFRLLRFLRKDDNDHQDPVSAAVQYRKFLKWRIKEGIDIIRANVENDYHHHHSRRGSSGLRVEDHHHHYDHNFDVLARLLPCDFHPVQQEETMDKTTTSNNNKLKTKNIKSDTIPIILYMGDWDIAELTRLVRHKELSIKDILHYWIYILESLHRELYMQSLQHKRMMYVDEICLLSSSSSLQQQQGQKQKTILAAAATSPLSSSPSPSASCLLSMYFWKKIVRPVLTMTQAYYPETTRRIRLINPTRFTSFVWNAMIKSLLKPRTRAKVELVHDQIPILQHDGQQDHWQSSIDTTKIMNEAFL